MRKGDTSLFEQDYFMKQIEIAARGLAKLVFNKETANVEIIDDQGNFSEIGFFHHIIMKMVHDGEINKAEDLLFEEIEKDCSKQNVQIAIYFYAELAQLSDRYLESNNFSREEIAEGLQYVRSLYEHQIQ